MQSTREVDLYDIQFKHPFNAIAAGPSGSGKTYLIRDILENHQLLINNINKKHINVCWAYGIWQNLYNTPLENVNFKYIEGIPEEEDVIDTDIIVIDDLMSEIKNSKYVIDLFTKGSHHKNISVIFITQNLFHQGSQMRTIGLNCHYLIYMKSARGRSQLRYLGRDLFTTKDFLPDVYDDATQKPFSYIRIDLTQETPEKYRVCTNLIPDPLFRPLFYVPK